MFLRAKVVSAAVDLATQGAPVVTPSSELPPGPHSADGFSIRFWTCLQPDPDRTVTAADCAAMLVDLHSVLRSYPGELPLLCATDIPRGMQLLDQAGYPPDPDITAGRVGLC